MGTWLLLTLSALAGDFQSRDKQGHPTRAILLGGSGEGHWNTGVSLGAPWATATIHRGLRGGWTPLAEVQTATFARWQPAVNSCGTDVWMTLNACAKPARKLVPPPMLTPSRSSIARSLFSFVA